MELVLVILGVIVGGALTFGTTIWAVNLQKPRLDIRIPDPDPQDYSKRQPAPPAREVTFLSVEVFNDPLTGWQQRMTRNAAIQCYGEISFHHLDGQPVFKRVMMGRWGSAPQPVAIEGVLLGTRPRRFQVFDFARFQLEQRKDIYPGYSGEFLNIAARFDKDKECYGWNNESYFSRPQWRNPDWQLDPGRYLVKVTVHTPGAPIEKALRLINDVPLKDFRLEPALQEDWEKLGKWRALR